MLELKWDNPNERYYEHGLDRGVLYIPGKNPVPWNGLTGFDEGVESGATTINYLDGVIYLADVDASDFSGKMSALFFPDEFSECLGIPEATAGLYVDNQKPKRFSMAYRSLIGSGMTGDMFGYQIHLVYNVMASINTVTRKTLGPSSGPVEFNFDLVCTPVKLPGYRPTAHYIVDTRNMDPAVVTEVEHLIYGTEEDLITEPIDDPFADAIQGVLPHPSVLLDLMGAL